MQRAIPPPHVTLPPEESSQDASAVPNTEEEERRRRVSFQLGEGSTRYISESLEWAIEAPNLHLFNEGQSVWSALILHSGFITKWVEQYLEEERASRIKAEFRVFFERDYPAQHPEPASVSRHPTRSCLIQHDSPEPEDILVQPPVGSDEDWLIERREEFPELSTMALQPDSRPMYN